MEKIIDCKPEEGVGNGEIALMLAQLDEGTKEWLGELPADLTPEEIAWQPFEGGHSIGALMVHIAEVEGFWLHHVAAGEPYRDLESEALDGASIDQDKILWPTPPAGRPLSYYVELMASVRARTRELIGKLDDPERTALFRDRTFTLRWLLTHVIGHESYHGGQAVMLLILKRKGVK